MQARLSALVLAAIATLPLPTARGAAGDELRVAVATNFTATAEVLAGRFEERSGHRVTLVSGSTGKLYAQISNGARLDAFLAADSRRPELLELQGLAVAESRFTYARGRLVLWSPRAGYVDAEAGVLEHGSFRHLAIANPRLAPYGRAAQETLTAMGLWNELTRRLVRGENIGQAFQFVASGNAELGLVAYSQIMRPSNVTPGSSWLVPQRLHEPIDQQAVLLRDREAPRRFLRFLRGGEARAVLESYGYVVP